MSNVVVFGSLNMDLAIESERMPRRGETLSGWGFLVNAGGKGANQAVAAAKFGVPTYLIGAVGDDAFGAQIVSGLEGYGVRCDEVARVGGVETGVAVVLRSGGDNRIVISPGANHALDADDVISALGRVARPGDVLLAQLECDLDATVAALEGAHARGMTTMLNAAPACELEARVWSSVDVVCVNETECAALCGRLPDEEDALPAALEALVALGPRVAIITLGERGSAALADGRYVRQPATPVDAVDTTASGDTFTGVFAAARLRGLDLAQAMSWASAAAALTASRSGAQQAIPVYEDVARAMGEARGR